MPRLHKMYLLLGSNLGRKKTLLKKATLLIEERIGPVADSSSLYQTAAWGKTNQPDFLNQVLEVHTSLPPLSCMAIILNIELELGRVRTEKNAARTIDIDILYYDNIILNNPILTIPHPAIAIRNFVLNPLTEISPNFIHPVHQKTNSRLLQLCPDKLNVKKL